MMFKVVGALTLAIAVFLGYVSTRPGYFRYARSGVIQAPAEAIYPYLVDFHKGVEWSPYEQKDPQMKKTFKGETGVPGSGMEFDGNSEAGSGSLELLKAEPNKSVQLALRMTKPFRADNLIDYSLTPATEGGTRITWAMSGEGGFLSKLISVFINVEKMIGADMDKGISNLKARVESKPKG